eukprot:364743-Chlamydomonas_euryale.AAC.2
MDKVLVIHHLGTGVIDGQLNAANCIPDVQEATCLATFAINSKRVSDCSLDHKPICTQGESRS